MRLRLLLLVACLLPRLVVAQAVGAAHRAPNGVISGIVYDSLARAPLAGALVQLSSADSLGRFGGSTASDSLGRFAFDSIPGGRYLLGFVHPILDSLGLQPMVREVSVSGGRAVRADLALPSPERLRAAICGAQPSSADLSGVVVGFVRDARGDAPVGRGSVAVEWVELSLTTKAVVRRVPRLVATTAENGWFAACNVPSAGALTLTASRGVDSTDAIEVQVPAGGLLRRELFLGSARTVVTASATPDDSLNTHRVRVGEGRLSGIVTSAVGGVPIAGAQVGIASGPRVRTNERGEWTLSNVPSGTRMLEVHAVSYYPERRPVNVIADATPVKVVLSTFKAVLDTVKVMAGKYERERAGFTQRSQSGLGRYVTAADIARKNPIVTSDLFRALSGVRLQLDTTGFERQLLVRGGQGQDLWCRAPIYINGRVIDSLSADDIDSMVRPNEITGIEVYSAGTAPPQFQQGLSGCGSIVIWTK